MVNTILVIYIMKQKNPNTIIMKFGGTSVGSTSAIQSLITIVSSSNCIVSGVVVSAFSGVTNQLIDAAVRASKADKTYDHIFADITSRHSSIVDDLITTKSIHEKTAKEVQDMLNELHSVLQGVYLLKELSPKILDAVASYGERLSAYIIAQSFINNGTKAEYVDARSLVRTDRNFGYARVDSEQTYKKITDYYASSTIPLKIITGYIGSSKKGETTTLGRGGSDYTASLFASALNVSKIEIWTDVDGVLTADPRKVSAAFTVPRLTYKEAMEMSHFGAKVVYPQTMIPAIRHNIPLVIKNTFHPDFEGTTIGATSSKKYLIKGISSIDNISMFRLQGSGIRGISGIVARLFGALARQGINIILITQASSEYTVCFAIESDASEIAKEAIEEEFKFELRDGLIEYPHAEDNLAIIAIVGEQMRKTYGVAGKLFNAVAKAYVNIVAIAQGSSERNISFVIAKKDEIRALNALHQTFFSEKHPKIVTIYLVGTGLIGSTLLEQINALKLLVQNENIALRVVGIANSQKMIFEGKGIPYETWKTNLEDGQSMNLKQFVRTIIKKHETNTIFVDCTASEEITHLYPDLLHAQIAVVTPNKIANSSSMNQYLSIRKAAKESNAFFMYETNVCAGLPTLQTIHDLVMTGDEIIRIEGVFSGTLSYIFNNFISEKKFSEIVKEAQNEGYTEPDPRNDLNGQDVGRKLLIMARESGLNIELGDISVENLVPQSCRNAKDVHDFFSKLTKEDQFFDNLKTQALKTNKKLAYIGKIDVKNKIFTCKLEMIDASHPFFSLTGSDNIVAIKTKRYNKTPIVVKGPGAGAEVTADGVLSDIITIGKYYAYEK